MPRSKSSRLAPLILLAVWLPAARGASDLTRMRMCHSPSLSADGSLLAFEWSGDIWVGSPHGGEARRLTASPAQDSDPVLSRDGRRVAFRSDRSGTRQVYVVPVEGGVPRQVTFHSEGSRPLDWSPDGSRLLTVGRRDHNWTRAERLFYVDPDGDGSEQLVANAYAKAGRFEGDTGRLLIARLGAPWWRQGYQGARAAQAWRLDPTTGDFQRIAADKPAVRDPMWRSADQTLMYLDNESGVFNLHRVHADGHDEQLTHFDSGALVDPALADDAGVVVFRHLFDLYRLNLDSAAGPEKISLVCRTDTARDAVIRRSVRRATEVAFSPDGLEIALIAGDDLWVMDTVLRKPRCVARTPGVEAAPAFSPDGSKLAFVSEADGQPDLWTAERGDPDSYWWRNDHFVLQRLTDDAGEESDPQFSPDGERIAFGYATGELRVIGLDGQVASTIDTGWDTPDFQWSPDGEHFVYCVDNNNYNQDVFLVASDGSASPVNLSRHPDTDRSPRWSPDGSMIAFVGAREEDEVDIFVAHVAAAPPSEPYDQLAEAVAVMRQARVEDRDTESLTPPKLRLPIERIDDRVVRLRNPGVRESRLVWSPDSKRIAFSGDNGKTRDTYVVDARGDKKPRRLADEIGSPARWLKDGGILWLSDDAPGRLNAKSGDSETYSFRVYQSLSAADHYGAVFLRCWRMVRDTFYDASLHGADWTAVRERYLPMARDAVDERMLSDVIRMMLGELNASHQGFTRFTSTDEDSWEPRTAHLGAWFSATDRGDLEVVRTTPSARRAGFRVGQRVTHVAGQRVQSLDDLSAALTGEPGAPTEVRLGGEEPRTLTVMPISFSAARNQAYRHWVEQRTAQVERLSDGRLGYLHIRDMGSANLRAAEENLFAATNQREGLVVDVRFNGGGWTADRLLSMLAHPHHAVTYPRGGGPGYPHSRRVYASWNGPLIALCNESSVSNAEIFSHAIKSTGRGKLVGQATAGDVISTSSRSVMGEGRLRITHRGWKVTSTGENMEGAGATPDLLVESPPGEMSRGEDRQLAAAVEQLLSEIDAPRETAAN